MSKISKTLLIYIVSFVLFSNVAHGQDIFLMGGVNFSKLGQQKDNTSSINREYRPGFHIGPAVAMKLNDHFDLIPSLLFSLKREYSESTIYIPRFDNTNASYRYDFKSSINEYYLDLPITLKFNFKLGEQKLYALAGPYVNLRLFDDSTTELFIDGEASEFENQFEAKFSNRIDYGIQVGLGAELKSYVIQATYDYGFYRTMKYEDIPFEESVRNAVARITFGYKF
ncbi:porin family protein [Marivirga harenae]|uniref:porin family protein n=1 Tax=Marivirga harenae TaxID=2010992 RepID=UPI0026DF44EE|nr:porin family protein [Marivirga harenae]WKV13225.1 porin family protein [Marivirga harenae]|tara:strand:- start:24309 stop:24986 length:678 start_codon:yes stop_codon:yes gene_type:complete